MLSTDIAKPFQMKFCVNSEWLELVISLELIHALDGYEVLWDDQLQKYLESKAAASKDVVTVDVLYKIVEDTLHMYMTDKDGGRGSKICSYPNGQIYLDMIFHGSLKTMIKSLSIISYRLFVLILSASALIPTSSCLIMSCTRTSKS